MNFMFAILLLGFGLGARAERVGCGDSLVSDRERLSVALAHAVGRGEAIDDHLAQLDLDILNWADQRMAKLSAGRRENVFRVLEATTFGSRFHTDLDDDDHAMDDTSAQLVADENGLYLMMEALESNSEQARYTLRHELGHLFRFVTDGSLIDCARHVEDLVLDRRFGLLREEAHAAREDYRYLRRNYTEADALRLEGNVRAMVPLIEIAVTRGFLDAPEDDEFKVDFTKLDGREDRVMLVRIVHGEADARLLHLLRQALRMNEREFVRAQLERYR